MKESLYLHIPAFEELWYRQKIMQDPDTMSYNRGYDLDFDGYDKATGCIAFPEQKWADWYARFIGQEPRRFYAYIVRESDGEFIGEVNVHRKEDAGWYDMGIVLEAKYRGKGYAADALQLLLQHAFETMDADAVHNDFEEERSAALQIHLSAGFTRCRQENGILELLLTREQYFRQKAIRSMTSAISEILTDNQPSVYLYGSSVLDDFRLGWSDIDILVLTRKRISQQQAMELVMLRQKLSEKEPENPYYRLFEGGMLTLSAFLSGESDCVVYWGTSGQRIADTYLFDSFCLAELLQSGKLLHGTELRSQLAMPVYADFYADVKKYYESIRQHAQKTDRSFYSFGWLLDIAREIYTLRSGAVISKTDAAQWALDNKLCPVPDALETALRVRKNPMAYRSDSEIFNYAETLGPEIQRFADVLEKELNGGCK
ncbi:MAG: GNAT family N-acetyltransferase [Lachnospiraceae bacterium]|nr:GNAT family N-acetyltransferase [Lachnospiraceae bacterium]